MLLSKIFCIRHLYAGVPAVRKKKMISVSTGGFWENLHKTALKFIENGIYSRAFGGGLKHRILEVSKIIRNSNLKIHNYFPPPEVPFVLI